MCVTYDVRALKLCPVLNGRDTQTEDGDLLRAEFGLAESTKSSTLK